MQGLQRPHLILGDALGAFEIVDLNIDRSGAAGAAKHPGRRILRHLPAINGGEQGVDFGLFQYVRQIAASVPR